MAATSASGGWGRDSWWRRSSSVASPGTNRSQPSSENWKPWHRPRKPLSRRERRRRVDYAGVVTFNGTPGIPNIIEAGRFTEGVVTAAMGIAGEVIQQLEFAKSGEVGTGAENVLEFGQIGNF